MTVTLKGQRSEGGVTASKEGSRVVLRETFTYVLISDSKTTTRTQVLSAAGMPIVGLTTSTAGTCSEVDAQRDPRNWQVWTARATFSSDGDDQIVDPGNPSGGPTTWFPVWKIGNEYYDEIADIDAAGIPVVNSAGDPFDVGVVKRKMVSTYRFSQYESDSLTEKQISDKSNIVNDATYKGFTKRTLLLVVLGSERPVINGTRYRRIDFELRYKEGAPAGTFKES